MWQNLVAGAIVREETVDKKLVQASVVILADSHNPGILSSDYMKKLGLINEDPSNFVHTPMATVLEYGNEKMSFAVIPDRYSANLNGDINRHRISKIVEISVAYFRSLPVTPITASGFNLNAGLSFGSREAQLKFQAEWLEPRRLVTSFQGFDTLWGSTAAFHWNKENVIVTVKFEPVPDKNEMALSMNANIGIKGVEQNTKALEENYLDLVIFFEKLLGEAN
jgi:hypothetical protein